MNTIEKTISEDSIKTKETLIESVCKMVGEGKFHHLNKAVLIRGQRSLLEDTDIIDFVNNGKLISLYMDLVRASEISKKSFHQVDYLIFTKIQGFGKSEILSEDISEEDKTPEGLKKIYEKRMEEDRKEFEGNTSICFYILSKDGVEIQSFDMIDATDKQGNFISRVVSPKPIITKDVIEKEDGTKASALLVLAGRPIINIFDEEIRGNYFEINKEKLNTSVEASFDNDFNLFSEKSEFIKERDLQLGN